MDYEYFSSRFINVILEEDSDFYEAIRYKVKEFCTINEFYWQEQIYSDSDGYESIDDCLVQFGASKIVLIPEGWDWVIKIPVYGYCNGRASYYDSNDFSVEYDDTEDYEFACSRQLRDKGYTFPGYNYCQAEAIIGYEAEKIGLGDILIPTYYVGTFKDIPYYIQRKVCDIREDVNSKIDSQERYKKLNSHRYREFNNNFGGALIEQYGEERVNELLDFLKEWGINDLTSFSNYAIKDGKIVFFDYSGFDN